MNLFGKRKRHIRNEKERQNMLDALTFYNYQVVKCKDIVVKHTGEPFYHVERNSIEIFELGHHTSIEESTQNMITYFLTTQIDFTDTEASLSTRKIK